jgi:hypothetical protein
VVWVRDRSGNPTAGWAFVEWGEELQRKARPTVWRKSPFYIGRNYPIIANRGKDKDDWVVYYIVFLLLLYKILRAEACSILKLKILD